MRKEVAPLSYGPFTKEAQTSAKALVQVRKKEPEGVF